MTPRIQPADSFSLESACEEILRAEQQIRGAFGVAHPQHRFWVQLADLLNVEQSRARHGIPDEQFTRWNNFNRVLALAREFSGLYVEGRI